MYQLTIESLFVTALSIISIVFIVLWRSAVSSRKSDLAYIYHVIEAINKGVELPPYGCQMDKHVKFLFLYVSQMAKEYKRLKDAENERKERTAQLLKELESWRPQIISVPQPIDSLTWCANFFNGLGANFMVPDIPEVKPKAKPDDSHDYFYNFFRGLEQDRHNYIQRATMESMAKEHPATPEKAESKVKHNGSIAEKPKAYFYDSSKTLGNIEMCQFMKSRIGSEYCLKRCDFYISHGSNQKGRYIKCANLDKALGK